MNGANCNSFTSYLESMLRHYEIEIDNNNYRLQHISCIEHSQHPLESLLDDNGNLHRLHKLCGGKNEI